MIGGHRYSLDVIEHGLLRGNRRPPFAIRRTLSPADPRLVAAPSSADPRIHFALNCGAVSCPPVRPYGAEDVGASLDAATRGYLQAESSLDRESGRLVLPGLMRLYRLDFADRGGVLAFSLPYLPAADAGWLRSNPGVRVDWSRFDWTMTASTNR